MAQYGRYHGQRNTLVQERCGDMMPEYVETFATSLVLPYACDFHDSCGNIIGVV